MMPRDVSTRWNSTYDMLAFAFDYRSALDIITGDRSMDLRKFEMSQEEWTVAEQLREVLKVCFRIILFSKY
jgi:hypothetical protein